MSCLPGMKCFDTLIKTIYANDCDPCANTVVDASKVEYSGPNLPCTGIQSCDTLETSLQKIDNKICSDELVAQMLAAIQASPTLKSAFCSIVASC